MKRKRRTRSQAADEPRTAEVLTIGWMLMVVTTLVCEVGSAAGRFASGVDEGPLRMLSELLLFAALVIGFIGLMITPVVMRSRQAPPAGIVAFAVVVTAAPFVMVAVEVMK
jgi:hypothetical protein